MIRIVTSIYVDIAFGVHKILYRHSVFSSQHWEESQPSIVERMQLFLATSVFPIPQTAFFLLKRRTHGVNALRLWWVTVLSSVSCMDRAKEAGRWSSCLDNLILSLLSFKIV